MKNGAWEAALAAEGMTTLSVYTINHDRPNSSYDHSIK